MFHYGPEAFAHAESDAGDLLRRAQLLVRALPHPQPRQTDGTSAMPARDGATRQRIVLDGGRIGPIVVGERVGLRLWRSGGGTGELVVWIHAEAKAPEEIVARCLMAVDAPIVGWSDGDDYGCELAAITQLTGLSDEDFELAAGTMPDPRRASIH